MTQELRCPVCGGWLDEDDPVYVYEDGTPAGCAGCIHLEYGWQRARGAGQEDES